MSKSKLLKLTAVVHLLLATLVAVDATRTGRSKKWVLLTLVAGVVGLALYLRGDDDEDLPLDELVDRVELD